MSYKAILYAAMAALALGGSVSAQEQMTTGSQPGLPEACKADTATSGSVMSQMGSMMSQMGMPEMDEAHGALAAGMPRMGTDMAAAMTAQDVDVAFACSMLAHHQGAIDMSRAELQYGDEPWAREMAQKVITAQEQEIKDIIAWLETR